MKTKNKISKRRISDANEKISIKMLPNNAELYLIRENLQNMDDQALKNYRRVLRLRMERMRKLKLAFLTVFVSVSMILICSLSYRTIKTNANSGFKYYTSITVEEGESLWDLADSYIDYDYYKNKNSYIAEVSHINHLDESGSITAGQILIFPYYSGEYK